MPQQHKYSLFDIMVLEWHSDKKENTQDNTQVTKKYFDKCCDVEYY